MNAMTANTISSSYFHKVAARTLDAPGVNTAVVSSAVGNLVVAVQKALASEASRAADAAVTRELNHKQATHPDKLSATASVDVTNLTPVDTRAAITEATRQLTAAGFVDVSIEATHGWGKYAWGDDGYGPESVPVLRATAAVRLTDPTDTPRARS